MICVRSTRPQPSSLFGTGPVSVSSDMSVAELISAAFTNAGDGVEPYSSRYHCTKTAAAPDTCGPAWLVPP